MLKNCDFKQYDYKICVYVCLALSLSDFDFELWNAKKQKGLIVTVLFMLIAFYFR